MHYVPRRQRDSITVVAPLLLAIGSLGLLAILWRRSAAPRVERTRRRRQPDAEPARTPTVPLHSDEQCSADGTGALIHRCYEVSLPLTGLVAADLLRLMQRHLTELAPSALADFEKTIGSETSFRVGDEYNITMLGPWNGRVRVSELTELAFTLVTLDGHPEAGHITFSVGDSVPPGTARVQIESWARARDAIVNTAYATLGIGKQVQTEVWITFLQRLGALAGAADTPQVRITTEEIPEASNTKMDTADQTTSPAPRAS